MIELQHGDILEAKADALVNTVNCVGVMGRGIALQFSRVFPEVFKAYEAACKRGELEPGKVLSHDLSRLEQPHYVINVPTKKDWRGKSRMQYIEAGLDALVQEVRRLGVKSIAVPPLGCGLGGLDWLEVRSRIEQAFEELPDVHVLLFEPKGAPSAAEMAQEQKTPKMTEGRALLLGLMRRYLAAALDPTVTLLEIHKLMYFMQESGQELRLKYAKGPYGPYAENLRHVLKRIEGHLIVGYGDGADKPDKPLAPRAEAVAAAEAFLKNLPRVHERFDRVVKLIKGFETPYGMELLSTLHWVATREAALHFATAVEKTYSWNERKRMFSQEHLRIAWDTLTREGWVGSTSDSGE